MADVTLKMLLLGEDRSASKALKGVGDQAQKTGKRASTAASMMKGALSAGVIMQAGRAVVDFGKDSIDAYRGAAKSQRQLDDAFTRFPQLAGRNADGLRKLNQAIQDKNGADADDIAAGQAKLATYGLNEKQLKNMTPLLVDYAKKTGKDIPTAAATLGKGIMGSSRAMKELGVGFKDTKDPAKNLEQIMDGLKGKVGGFADKEAGSLDGKLSILETKFGDVQESVGQALVPALTELADTGLKVIDWVSKNTDILAPLAAGLAAGAVAWGVMTAAMALHTAYTAAAAAAEGGLTVGQWALNAALNANPIALVVIAIAALVAGLIWAYNNVDWFRQGVDTAFQAIGAIGRWLWNNALAPVVRAIIQGFAWVVDGIAGMLEALGQVPGFEWATDAARGMRQLASDARDAADGIKDIPEPVVETDKSQEAVKKLNDRIRGLKGKIVEAKAKGDTKEVERLKRKIDALRDKRVTLTANVKVGASSAGAAASKVANAIANAIDGRAEGGPISAGVPYVVGEQGPELILPESDGYVLNASKTAALAGARGSALAAAGGQTVIIHAPIDARGALDDVAVGKRVEKALTAAWRAQNRRPLQFQGGR